MATKKLQSQGTGFVIEPAAYQSLLKVMDELAFRGPDQEAIVMRIAKAAGLTEAMKPIIRRRMYAKRRDAAVAERQPRPGKLRKPGGTRRRSDRVVQQPGAHPPAVDHNDASPGEGVA